MTTTPTNDDIRRSNRLKLTWGLIALIGPTALIVIGVIVYAIMNFVFSTVETSDASMSSGGGPIRTIVNIVLFLSGALSVVTWLPGIIVGIILLATRKPVPQR